MKIRSGFVSNSSSSSFVIFGKKIRMGEITPELIEQGRIYALSYKYCDDGVDFFEINQAMYDMYRQYGGELGFYEVDEMICESGKISKDKIQGDEINVMSMEVSYHTVQKDDLKSFVEMFIWEGII